MGRKALTETGDELSPLLALVERLKETLVPVEPSLAFVKPLDRRLMASARRKDIQMAKRHRWGILIGAALGSVVSVAGLIAYLLRSRAKARHAT